MSPAWHDTARSMLEQGCRQVDIVRVVGRSAAAVSQLINPPPKRGDFLDPQAAERPKPHVSRQPRRILPADSEIMALCRQFAAGELDRVELARRLRVSA